MAPYHYFLTEFADRYGVEEAMMLTQICYWVENNKAEQKNFHEGRYWTYNSISSFREFWPYLTESQIRTGLRNLIERGVLQKGNFNKLGYDRTTWYSVSDETMEIFCRTKSAKRESSGIRDKNSENGYGENPVSNCENNHMDLTNLKNPSAQTDKPIPLQKQIEKAAAANKNFQDEKEEMPNNDQSRRERLKAAFREIDPSLTFHDKFFQQVENTMNNHAVDVDYFKWVYGEVMLKKPRDVRALYYKLAFETDMLDCYKAKQAEYDKTHPEIKCPVCGTVHEYSFLNCPHCNFEVGKYAETDEVDYHKKYTSLSSQQQSDYDKRLENIYRENGLSFENKDKVISTINELKKEFGFL
jgi:hypothetical protein